MKTKTKKVPIAEWLAMKLVADEFGGVGRGAMFSDGSGLVDDGSTSYFEQPPCCIIGIAMEAGVLPLGMLLTQSFYRDVHWETLDVQHMQIAPHGERIPFEKAMAAYGFEPALR